MNDEFQISYTVIDGSQNGSIENYCLNFENHCTDVNEMSLEEIIRLKDFLISYVSKKGGDNGSK